MTMRIVFMGTPDFAVPSLEALLKSDDQVVGVVTQPDRPKGRGQEVIPSPVKVVCQREGIPMLQPLKMKAPEFMEALRQWKPDVIAVAAFGRILPPAILALPPRRLHQRAWVTLTEVSRRGSRPVGCHQG